MINWPNELASPALRTSPAKKVLSAFALAALSLVGAAAAAPAAVAAPGDANFQFEWNPEVRFTDTKCESATNCTTVTETRQANVSWTIVNTANGQTYSVGGNPAGKAQLTAPWGNYKAYVTVAGLGTTPYHKTPVQTTVRTIMTREAHGGSYTWRSLNTADTTNKLVATWNWQSAS